MHITEFLSQSEPKISMTEFGRRIGVSPEAIRRYATEGRVPTPGIMAKIVEITGGAVQPNDFYDYASKDSFSTEIARPRNGAL